MTTKLTITIEDSVAKKAKIFAQKNGHSLSHLIEKYLLSIVNKEADKNNKEEMSARVKRLKGAIKLPENFEYKKTLEEALLKKYEK
jgi:Family of unknown function (DUF6364)